MKDLRKTELKVGIMSILGIIIFLWILGWAKNFSFTSEDKLLVIKFENVSGLEIGDQVTVNGVRKGNVEDIAAERERVLVKVRLDENVDLRKDASFSISMLDLMGGKKIEVRPGSSNELLDYNQIQQGVFYSDIPAVMSLFGSVQDDMVTAIKDLRITLSSINKYLTDEDLSRNIRSSLENLRSVSQKLNVLIDENRTNLNKLTSNTVELTEEAKNFIKDNKENIRSSITDMQKVIKQTDSLLSKVNKLADEFRNKENNIGKLLYDEELLKNIQQSLNQVNELTRLLIEQLKSEGLKVDADINIF